MDYTDKIKEFSTLETLETEISHDLVSKDVLAQRYCVRFIMLNNFEAYRSLFKFLTDNLKVETLDLENLALGEDKTVTIDALIDEVQGLQCSTIITPFSELARFYKESDFRGFFNEIILTEDIAHPYKRIYIPIIGLHNRFTDFLKNFARLCESAPIWQYYKEEADNVTVYLSKYKNFKLADSLGICQLGTMREWLKFWKRQAPQDKILCGALPILRNYSYAKPDSIFNFHEVKNAYDFITDFLNIHLPIEYNPDEECYWDEFLNSINKASVSSFNLERYVRNRFNRMSFTFNDILGIWSNPSKTEYDRWLLKQYLLNSELLDNKPYLKLCLSELNEFKSPNPLFIKVADRIFYLQKRSEQEKFAEERSKLMNTKSVCFKDLVPLESQEWIKTKIVEIAQNDNNLSLAKKVCTSTFDFERPMFIGWYLLRAEKDFGISELKIFYPDLYYYLQSVEPLRQTTAQRWITSYLQAYRQAKIKDVYTSEIKALITKYNQDEKNFYQWYYSFENCHSLLDKSFGSENKPDKVFWFDGLGAEFYPFIQHVIDSSDSDFEIITSEYAVTGIPSNTHLNSFEVDNRSVYKKSGLDELAHENIYRKYTSLVEELEVLKQEVLSILNENKHSKQTIAFVSDHGLSVMSRLCESLKVADNAKHEGRYVEVEGNLKSDTDFLVCENDKDNKKYMVALKHASLKNKPVHEVHGGCTPEEVIVPFIIISNIDKNKPVKYKIDLLTPKVAVSDGEIKFSIMPEPKSAKVVINDKTLDLKYNQMQWTVKLPNPAAGMISLQVIPFCGNGQLFDVELYGMGFNSSFNDFDTF